MALVKDDPKLDLYTLLEACKIDAFKGAKIRELCLIYKKLPEYEQDPKLIELLKSQAPVSSSAADVRNFWLEKFDNLISAKLKFFTSSNPFTENPEQILLAQQKSRILEDYGEILATKETLNMTKPPTPPVKPSLNSSAINNKMLDHHAKRQKLMVNELPEPADETIHENSEQFFDPIDENNEQKALSNPKNSSPKPGTVTSNLFQTANSGGINLDTSLNQNTQMSARNTSLPGSNFNVFSPISQHPGMLSPVQGVFPQLMQPQFYQQQQMQNFGGQIDQKDQVSEQNLDKIISRIDLYFAEKLKIETGKINTKLNSHGVDISLNQTNILNNKAKIEQNSSKIEEIKTNLPGNFNWWENLTPIKKKSLWVKYRCAKDDYRNHVFGRLNSGNFRINFVDAHKFCETYTDTNGDQRFNVKITELQRQISKGTQDSIRFSIDAKFISANNKFSALVRLTNNFNTRRTLAERILQNRNQHRGLLGVSLNLPDKYNIEDYLRLLVETHVDGNGQKVFLKSGTSRKWFYFLVLNDGENLNGENWQNDQNMIEGEENPRENQNATVVSILAPSEFLKIDQKDLTVENLRRIRDFENWFYCNGKFLEKDY